MRFILILLTTLIFNSGFCCSCVPKPNVETSYKLSDIVIAAKVIEIIAPKIDTSITKNREIMYRRAAHGYTIKLELISIYKGKKMSKYLTILPEESNCEYYFQLGQEYLIYGWIDNGGLRTNVCYRTAQLEENNDLVFLEQKFKKRRTIKSKKKTRDRSKKYTRVT
ncbi:MAG: hypothetical protein ACPGSD_13410 [Flavobacteriales bacterium]